MDVTIIGVGPVGLMQAAGLAKLGHTVYCHDIDSQRLSLVREGKSPYHEPGLDDLVRENHERIIAKDTIPEAVDTSSVSFLCVGTPPYQDGSANLRFLYKSAREVARNVKGKMLIVEKSTVPAGTAQALKKIADKPIYVASNPEFLAEGTMVKDFFNPDRIVVGVDASDPESAAYAKQVMTELYRKLPVEIDFTDLASAELVKHVSNFMLTQRISTTNFVGQVSEKVGADVTEVMRLVGKDKRIGPYFLRAGIGYGGSCFPKDSAAFAALARTYGIDPDIIYSVTDFNKEQKEWFVRKADSACNGLEDKLLGVLGLAFKPDTDDMRYAPSIDIIRMLQERGAKVQAYDPAAMENAKKILRDVTYCQDAYETLKGADAMLLLTEWKEFGQLDFSRVKQILKQPVIIDGRNMYRPEHMRSLGFEYQGVGRR